ncbi:MAG: hydroxymethylbilane synthase [Gammaproteobacteria bacterium]
MENNQSLRIATRGSDLALTQARGVADSLQALGVQAELEVIRTAGDRSTAERFADIGPQGIFVREIEQALLEKRADIAVHSCKDLPTESPDTLCIGAIPPRFDAHDVLLIRRDALRASQKFAPLKRASRVGTSSARRQAWLKHFRHDLDVVGLRGNVPTRLARLRDGDYDAIVLAAAGLDRLNAAEELLTPLLADVSVFPLEMSAFVPAPAQGAIAVQCRSDDRAVRDLLAKIDDQGSRICVEIERAALANAEGGCEVAFGAHCRRVDQAYELTCMLERNGQVHAVTSRSEKSAGLGAAAWRELEREFAGE